MGPLAASADGPRPARTLFPAFWDPGQWSQPSPWDSRPTGLWGGNRGLVQLWSEEPPHPQSSPASQLSTRHPVPWGLVGAVSPRLARDPARTQVQSKQSDPRAGGHEETGGSIFRQLERIRLTSY